jgi:large subunit ribosomal protein L2
MSNLIYFCKTRSLKLKSGGLISKAGRNLFGRICIQGRGGKQKRLYRLVDFYRRIDMQGIVLKFFYDCNRTSHLALIFYKNGIVSYIPAIKDLGLKDIIFSGNCFSEINQKQVA